MDSNIIKELMEQRISIITLGIKNLEIATNFYEQKLGWKKLASSNDNISFFQLNGILLSLFPKDKLAEDASVTTQNSNVSTFTLAHLTRSKEEVDELFQQFEQKGISIAKQPEETFWGGYSGYIADPDGNLWEIAFNPYVEMDAEGNLK